MNVNEVLANRANEILGGKRGEYTPVHPNDHVNMAQSHERHDPDRRSGSACSRSSAALDAAFEGLRDALAAKGTEFDDVVKAGRTHLQDAMPIRLGQEFTAYAGSIDRGMRRVNEAADYLRDLGIGGSAVGTGVTVEPEYPGADGRASRSEITGLELRVGRRIAFSSCRAWATSAAFSAQLSVLAIDLSKIASDLRLMVMGPRTGHRRDHAAGRAAGLVDHAGQDQSVDSGDGESGLLPGHRQRHDASRSPPSTASSS